MKRHPWMWVPSLYFAEGLPYIVVMTVSGIMYKRLGVSNSDITLYTSLLYLPWVIKPVWSPLIDMFRTKRFWVVTMQAALAVALALVAFAIPGPDFFRSTLAVFWVMAFCSATHDIAADGFYMLGLDPHDQAAYVGVRSTFYRVATVTGQGLLVILAGQLEQSGGTVSRAWSFTFMAASAVFVGAFAYHRGFLPRPPADRAHRATDVKDLFREFLRTFLLFFRKKNIVGTILFLLLYRFAEAQLVKLVAPFLLDPRDKGGLGLGTSELGFVYGTVGVLALTLGGLLGGYLASRIGLKASLWIMVGAIHLPDLAFVYLSQVQPANFFLINAAVAVEQFGYGFGFTAYMLYMITVSEGEYKTTHFAMCTGFMALGMALPGLFSGALQEFLGYKTFFLWVMLSTVPGFLVAAFVKIDPEFGKRKAAS